MLREMMKMGKGGMVLTGIGAYLIMSQVISLVRNSVHDISSAMKWRAYYKYGQEGAVPPGYSKKTTRDNDEVIPSSKIAEAPIKAVVTKAIDDLFKPSDAPEEALEGETEPFKEDISEKTEKEKDEDQ